MVDINYIKNGLEKIGYIVSDGSPELKNNESSWQIKFNNSEAIVNVYKANNKGNTVIQGKPEEGEKESLKSIVERLKHEEIIIDDLNLKIVNLINSKKEDYYYDFKQKWHDSKENLLHDILCLSNNLENEDAYLIIGVSDNNIVCGINDSDKRYSSNDLMDFLRGKQFAGNNKPDIYLERCLYKFKQIDVLVCKASPNVPFYLEKNYKGVFAHQIYTRNGDTNTPKNCHASYDQVKRLWRVHFSSDK